MTETIPLLTPEISHYLNEPWHELEVRQETFLLLNRGGISTVRNVLLFDLSAESSWTRNCLDHDLFLPENLGRFGLQISDKPRLLAELEAGMKETEAPAVDKAVDKLKHIRLIDCAEITPP